jgi:hypothetical protein
MEVANELYSRPHPKQRTMHHEKFQVLQHRMVDMMFELEQVARWLSSCATPAWQTKNKADERRALSRHENVIGRSGQFIFQNKAC